MSAPLPTTPEPTPGYAIWEPHPFVFKFPENDFVAGVHWYGLAYVAGFLIAHRLLGKYHAKGRSPLGDDARSTLMFFIALGVMIGGRLGYVFGYMLAHDPHALTRDPLVIFRVGRGGMASHGGMIGIALAVAWCSRKFKTPFLRLADIIVTLGPPGVILGRLANFVNGELWGKETTAPWAVVFRNPDAAGEWLTPRHPSQLYAMALEGVLLTAWTQRRFWKKNPLPPGRLTGEFMLGYALVRIIGELWREPDRGVSLVLGLSRGQFYSLFLGAAGIAVIALSIRREKRGVSV